MTIDVLQWYLQYIIKAFADVGITTSKVMFGYEEGYADEDGEVYPWFIEAESFSGRANEINCYRLNGATIEQCVDNLPDYVKASAEYYSNDAANVLIQIPDGAYEN